jgi:type I restriction enzyme R subunit
MSEFYNPEKETSKHGDTLPHWQQGEVMQFVTFRLADSMPQAKLRQWKDIVLTWKQRNSEPWTDQKAKEYHRRFTWKLERWLDQGHGSCILADPLVRIEMERTLMHDEGTRARHHAWVIMPNHVHLLFTPLAPLPKIMQSWKGISARRIGQGSIWQRNYRDTLIRDCDHFVNAIRYIRRNPAKLPAKKFTLWQSRRAASIE